MSCKALALGATALALAVGGTADADDITLTTTVTQLPAAVDAGAGNTYRVTGAADAVMPTGVMQLGSDGLGGTTSIGFAGALTGIGNVQIYFQQGNGGSGGNPAPTETVDLTAADFSGFTGQLMLCNSWNNNAIVKLHGDLASVTYLFGGVSQARNYNVKRGYDASDRGADTLHLTGDTVFAGVVGAPKGATYGKDNVNVNAKESIVVPSSGVYRLSLAGDGDYEFYGSVGASDKRMSLTKRGAGTQTLGGANYFQNVTLAGGTLRLAAGTSIADTIYYEYTAPEAPEEPAVTEPEEPEESGEGDGEPEESGNGEVEDGDDSDIEAGPGWDLGQGDEETDPEEPQNEPEDNRPLLVIDGCSSATVGLTARQMKNFDWSRVIFNFSALSSGRTQLLSASGLDASAISADNIRINGELFEPGPKDQLSFAVVDDVLVMDYVTAVDFVRVHPWLTRGAGEEAILGFRGLVTAGGKQSVNLTVRFDFTNCTADDFECFRFYRQPSACWNAAGECSIRGGRGVTIATSHFGSPSQTGANSLWYHRPTTAGSTYTINITNNGNGGSMINLSAGDSLWVIVQPKTTISPDASFTATVVGDEITVNGKTFPVNDPVANDPAANKVYRVNPFRHRIGAYIRANAANVFDNFTNQQPDERFRNLTEILFITDEGRTSGRVCDVSRTADGQYEITVSQSFIDSFNHIKSMRDQYSPDTRLKLVSLHHPNSDGTETDALSTAMKDAYRAHFVESVVNLLVRLGADGFDADWEYCHTASQFQNYAKTMSAIKDECFRHGWEISAAMSGNYRWQPRATCAVLDYINIMSYGGNLNSTLAVQKSHCNRFVNLGVPKARLVVGHAIYATGYQQPGWQQMVNHGAGIDTDYKTINGNNYAFTGPVTYRAQVRHWLDEGFGGVMSWGYYTDVSWRWYPTLSLGRAQAQVVWPVRDWTWPEPERDGDTYVLKSERDWFWFADNAATATKVRLGNDITFTHDPKPVPSFSGELDGDGHALIFPETAWIVTYNAVGLFAALDGTVKNLTVDLAGKIISRRDRKGEGGGDVCGGVLAACLNGGATVENVRLVLRAGSEVRAPHEVGALAGQLYTGGAALSVRGVTADISGKLSSWTANAYSNDITIGNGGVGGVIGQFNWADSYSVADNGALLSDCTVILRGGTLIESPTGNYRSAGGAIGNLNKAPEGHIDGLHVMVYPDVRIVCSKEGSEFYRQPYVGSRWNTSKSAALPLAQGSLTVLDADFYWTDLSKLWVRETEGETVNRVAVCAADGDGELTLTGARHNGIISKLPVTPSSTTRKIKFDTVANAEAVYCFGNVNPEVVVPAQPENARLKFASGADDAADETLTLTSRWSFGVNGVWMDGDNLVIEASAFTGDGVPATFAPGTVATLLERDNESGVFAATDIEATQPDGRVGIRRFTLPTATDSAAHLYKTSVSRP